MAQFDVHRNNGRSARIYPYLVIMQSGLLRNWDRRIVVPLAVDPGARLIPAIMPELPLEGRPVYFAAHEIANVPRTALGELVANWSDRGDVLIGAMDQVLSRGYRD